MEYKKSVEIVFQNDDVIIATVWTGPNFYIGAFPIDWLDDIINHCNTSMVEIIRNTSVRNMMYLCKFEDYSEELLNEYIAMLLKEEIDHDDP